MHIGGIDVVVDHDDVFAEIGAAGALRGERHDLRGVAAYICLIDTTVMPQPAASGIDQTPWTPGMPSLVRSDQIAADRNAAQNKPHSLAGPSAISAQVKVGLLRKRTFSTRI